ncbi:sulfatase family protein [Zunongwangia profunda]|uniref:sulfatase family protein n=1 Tax=Zunongwangia profunda TaxID=398743 RepID=UPI001D189B8D|nr:sulfatase [Zunongwangia profunda]MCC4226811.1 sulfatase [Zunongwangia profunda]
MKHLSYFILLIMLGTFIQCASTQEVDQAKPNVILLYIDDMGYGDLEPYGQTGVETPNFNKLAAEGIRFTNFEVAQPICTASRAALLTGTYPNRIGMGGVLLPASRRALNPDETTIASMLKENNYATAIFGKWHLGNKPPYWPLNYGFDEFFGIPYSHDIWPLYPDGYTRVTNKADIRSSWPPLPLIEGNKITDTVRNIDDTAKLTTVLTERTLEYIDKNRNNPFFIYLAHPLPHVPLAVSDKFKDKSRMGLYGDVVKELDWSLGKIMEHLKELNLDENTILIVASDNGPWLKFGNHGGSSGGLREGKSTTFEGGNRVPFFMKWKNHIPAGEVNGQLMTNMDVLPTIAAATHSKLPSKRIDGINYLPFLTGETPTVPRDIMYYYFSYGENSELQAIRYKKWKLVLPHTYDSYEGSMGKDGKSGKTTKKSIQYELYDLSHDPGENYDISKLYPEMIEKLKQIAEESRSDLGDSNHKIKPTNAREPARY